MNGKETFVGFCSEFIDRQGWTTVIPVKELNAKGYYKCDLAEIEKKVKKEIAQTFAMAQYVDGYNGLVSLAEDFIKEYAK